MAKITSWFLPSYVHRPAFFRWRLAPPWTNLPKCETNRSVFKTMTFARQIPKTVHSWGHKNITTPLANTVTKIVSACYWAIFCRHTFILDTDPLPVVYWIQTLCLLYIGYRPFACCILDTDLLPVVDPLPVDFLCRHTFILDTDPLPVHFEINLCEKVGAFHTGTNFLLGNIMYNNSPRFTYLLHIERRKRKKCEKGSTTHYISGFSKYRKIIIFWKWKVSADNNLKKLRHLIVVPYL